MKKYKTFNSGLTEEDFHKKVRENELMNRKHETNVSRQPRKHTKGLHHKNTVRLSP